MAVQKMEPAMATKISGKTRLQRGRINRRKRNETHTKRIVALYYMRIWICTLKVFKSAGDESIVGASIRKCAEAGVWIWIKNSGVFHVGRIWRIMVRIIPNNIRNAQVPIVQSQNGRGSL